MNNGADKLFSNWAWKQFFICVMLFAGFAAHAGEINIEVVDHSGAPVSGFRWLVQEDTTFDTPPGVSGLPDILAFNFHKSYQPPAKNASGSGLTGNSDTGGAAVVDVPDGRYYVSVLPYSGYSMSGAPAKVIGGSTPTVRVVVQKHPIPTAQISLFLFHDNQAVNMVPDLPQEQNPPVGEPGHVDWTNFTVILEEPAGRYGIAGGQVIQDAFGNPLGSEYLSTCGADGQGIGSYGCLDAEGNPTVISLGDGTLSPDENGLLRIKNLVPGKYAVIVIPPSGSGWQQITTIEGTKVIDAWVRAREPSFLVEFGPLGPHIFMGFIKSSADGGFPPLSGSTTVSGQVRATHSAAHPQTTFHLGRPFPGCWVALNTNTAGTVGEGVFAAPCDDDSTFEIANVAPGDYTLVVWDAYLDSIISFHPFNVDSEGSTCNNGQSCDFGKLGGDPITTPSWFSRLETGVFNDVNQNGFWDTGESGIGPESQDISLRWRDGTIYSNFPTDNDGLAPFDEVFPFFHWLVAEVSFANKKATGATFVVDSGGEIPADDGWDQPSLDVLTPAAQCVDDGSGTGATVSYIESGGTWTCPTGSEDVNAAAGNNRSRTETGQVLTIGYQGFADQTSIMHFGKTDYKVFDFNAEPPTFIGENGGISGIIYYATTRAEDEPQYAAAEEWEPGIPRVQLALYADGDIDSHPQGDFPNGIGDVDWNGNSDLDLDDDIIDDIDGDGFVTRADVDNYPFGFSECTDHNNDNTGDGACTSAYGLEDVDRDGDGFFDLGDAVQVTWTDSWDDSLPTGCQGVTFFAYGITKTDCFDGLRNWNQLRPAVFDGGFAFADYDLAHLEGIKATNPAASVDAVDALNAYFAMIDGLNALPGYRIDPSLLPGDYIVEASAPPGYEHIKEEDRNIDFGDEYVPSPEALPVACIGVDHLVPPVFSMLTKDGSGAADQLIAGADAEGSPFAGVMRPLCDLKKVPLSGGQNAAAEFFLMTDVPPVANIAGMTANDLGAEFNPDSPTFGEKPAPRWIPVAFYDFNGDPLNRVYGDEFGNFNLVLSSTWTANVGMPSGMSPHMAISCVNDAGPIANPACSGGVCPTGVSPEITDPFYNPQYSQTCYTFQYMPGTVTYLDVPVVPVSAFASDGGYPLDCERPTQTPVVASVTRVANDGPFALHEEQIRLGSMGLVEVTNPEWDGTDSQPKKIQRDYGFGDAQGANGKVELESLADGSRTSLAVDSWGDEEIVATLPVLSAGFSYGEYRVVVAREFATTSLAEDPLAESQIAATLTVGRETSGVEVGVRPNGADYNIHRVASNGSIQDAINSAAPGDLILVAPGTYDELVFMWKPVKLQGWGAGSVTINARPLPTSKLADWRVLANQLTDGNLANGEIDTLPGQDGSQFGFPGLDAPLFVTEEGAGIFVAGLQSGADSYGVLPNRGARIDGFTILGASSGGGIVVNGYADHLVISNNRVRGNAGSVGGGIRVGHPRLTNTDTGTGDLVYTDAENNNIRILHNQVDQNGTIGAVSSAGGGISMLTGSDDYQISRNWVCGNFTQDNGAGIAHSGLSDNGVIANNFVIFNETFSQSSTTSGAGIYVGGNPALKADGSGRLLTTGSGNVIVNSNIIRGNQAGGGDGGGLSIELVNGTDIANNLGNSAPWYSVGVFNNMINNNVTALAGGGITIRDAVKVTIRNNTVANNDSTATSGIGGAFPPGQVNLSISQPAGIVARTHSAGLASLLADVSTGLVTPDTLAFSDPDMTNNIILHNRSFVFSNAPATGAARLFPSCDDPSTAAVECSANDVHLYSRDLAVMEGSVESASYALDPQYSLLQSPGGSNVQGNTFNQDFNQATQKAYFNNKREQPLDVLVAGIPAVAGAFDEGGNFIQVAYGPLSLVEPGTSGLYRLGYHLEFGSNAINLGSRPDSSVYPLLAVDFDGEPRPVDADISLADIGADEKLSVATGTADSDDDGINDDTDNCIAVPNPSQCDGDDDGYGNHCDADLNNDGITNGLDIGPLKAAFGTADPAADLNCDGIVNGLDIGPLKAMFGTAPGPSSCCSAP